MIQFKEFKDIIDLINDWDGRSGKLEGLLDTSIPKLYEFSNRLLLIVENSTGVDWPDRIFEDIYNGRDIKEVYDDIISIAVQTGVVDMGSEEDGHTEEEPEKVQEIVDEQCSD